VAVGNEAGAVTGMLQQYRSSSIIHLNSSITWPAELTPRAGLFFGGHMSKAEKQLDEIRELGALTGILQQYRSSSNIDRNQVPPLVRRFT
jgi:hypothetical protein